MQTKRFVLIWLAFTAVASAQNFYPKKDAAFGQVVAGGGYETVINLTNRGTHPYAGTLILFQTVNHESVVWNPTINGAAVENGEYDLEIQPQDTVTLRLTGSQLEAGAAILLSEDLLLNNLIEANLTYLILEDGRVSDSVGIAPSKEFYRASIPFENFAETALALVNGHTSDEFVAEVDLTLYSGEGDKLRTDTVVLGPRLHRPRFLHEFFPGQKLTGGMVEISSDVLIFGTALTFAGGEFSSLPLEPAPVTYSIRLSPEEGPVPDDNPVATGEMTLWAEGVFVRGYLLISPVGGESDSENEFLHLVNGTLAAGQIRLSFTIFKDPFHGEEVTFSMRHDQFSFNKQQLTGTWEEMYRFPYEILNGTYELVRSGDR